VRVGDDHLLRARTVGELDEPEDLRLGPLRGGADDDAGLVADHATVGVVDDLGRRRRRCRLRRRHRTRGLLIAPRAIARTSLNRGGLDDLAARTGLTGLRRAAERTGAGLRRGAGLARARTGLHPGPQLRADGADRATPVLDARIRASRRGVLHARG